MTTAESDQSDQSERPEQSEPQASADAEPPEPGPQPDRDPMLGWSSRNGAETTIVFLRHGITPHTVDKMFSGPGGEDPGLVEEGRQQAKRAADALAADGGADVLISSPLRRTRETAQYVSDALGLAVDVDRGFRECGFGEWDAMTLDQVARRWPTEFDAWLHSMDVAPPGGEALTEVRERVERSLAATLERYAGQKVVVVSHVNPIKLAVRYCLDAPMEVMHRMNLSAGSFTTLSFYESGARALRQFSALP